MYNQKELNHTYLEFQKAPEIELYSCLMSIKLTSLEATLVQNYHPPTEALTDGGEV